MERELGPHLDLIRNIHIRDELLFKFLKNGQPQKFVQESKLKVIRNNSKDFEDKGWGIDAFHYLQQKIKSELNIDVKKELGEEAVRLIKRIEKR